ncbi:hypothetical protein MSAN_00301500 [Mycena sanguinolenta]|uniref:Uncharacterized protein n=1 Tax=Mycena sanguinolenta TaxID=230812 RepID=A0A8H6ZDB9_9AGAR|nr:hypothetical protein MSAN_00301500 [Mycena sanguinolenta]
MPDTTSLSTSSTESLPTNPVATPTLPTLPPAVKRKYDEIRESFPTNGRSKKKRAKRSPNAQRTAAERLDSVARYFVRAVHTFKNISSVMQDAAEHRWGSPAPDEPSNEVRMPASERARQQANIAAFDAMFTVAPDLLEVVKHFFLECSSCPDNWNHLTSSMHASATSARTSDTGGLKNCLHYVLPNPAQHVMHPPVATTDPKSVRGLAHPILRYLILGWPDRLRLPPLVFPTINSAVEAVGTPDDGPNEFLDRIVNGNVEIKNDALPSFLWAEGAYNPENFDKGLLRGEFPLRVLRHIWTGPRSAINGLDKGIPAVCNARLHNKYTVDEYMIANAVVQARGMLSTRDWAPRDGAFDNEKLFDQIVKLFSKKDDAWVIETLAWQVFGDYEAPAVDDPEETAEPSPADDILAQRAARQAAAASSAAAMASGS